MSLYQAGLKSATKTQSKVGDATKPSVEPFAYPPKNTHDALMMQKAYLFEKNGYMTTFRDVKDVPITNISDAWYILKFWERLSPPEADRPTSLKNAIHRSLLAINKTAAAYLKIPFNVPPDDDKRTFEEKRDDILRIAKLSAMTDTIVQMNADNAHVFWLGVHRIENELKNLPTKSQDSYWEAAQWIAVEAWNDLPEVMNRAGRWVADVIAKPIATAAGAGLGAFFNGMFEGLKTPVGIAGAGIAGYLGYQYFKNKKAPTFVINRGAASKKKSKAKATTEE